MRTAALALAVTAAACGGAPEPETTRSSLERQTPQVDPAQQEESIRASTDFAFELYRKVGAERGNLVFSPHSISSAFAMLWAGSRTTTEAAIAAGFGYRFAQPVQHPLFNALDAALASRNETVDDADRFTLRVVNDLWLQKGFDVLPQYLDTLATHYGAGVRRVDFATDSEKARETINDWVSLQTAERIPELFPKDALDGSTVLALTNAVYFKADWAEAFDPANTQSARFTLEDGSAISTAFMHKKGEARHAKTGEYEAVELAYAGEEVALLVIVPNDLPAFEASLGAGRLEGVVQNLAEKQLDLALPKWKHEKPYDLKPVLSALGMAELFGSPDLSGLRAQSDLVVQAAVHKAFILVDEEGSEAAAATGIAAGRASLPQFETVRVDRPFVYILRDTVSGAVLFVGRVVDPR